MSRNDCERCGACCAFDGWYFYLPVGGSVMPGHLSDFDGMDGLPKRIEKTWSDPFRVCIFLKRGIGCALHKSGEKPSECQEFDCNELDERRLEITDSHGMTFKEFKKRWTRFHKDRIVRDGMLGLQVDGAR